MQRVDMHPVSLPDVLGTVDEGAGGEDAEGGWREENGKLSTEDEGKEVRTAFSIVLQHNISAPS